MRPTLARSIVVIALVNLLALSGCKTAQEHAADVRAAGAQDNKVTVGTVQREIRVGMSSADVVAVLGSPNMVTTDSQRRENWVYDKISTERAYSTSSGGVSALILGGGLVGSGALGGGAGPSYSSSTGAASTSQRTLTIIIKYDKSSLVRDFAYRYSSF
jgi:outer membrane protein assembly factor BamE (lipoprotein component of BamABCDE complex)